MTLTNVSVSDWIRALFLTWTRPGWEAPVDEDGMEMGTEAERLAGGSAAGRDTAGANRAPAAEAARGVAAGTGPTAALDALVGVGAEALCSSLP